jgi:hypothetical protein
MASGRRLSPSQVRKRELRLWLILASIRTWKSLSWQECLAKANVEKSLSLFATDAETSPKRIETRRDLIWK